MLVQCLPTNKIALNVNKADIVIFFGLIQKQITRKMKKIQFE